MESGIQSSFIPQDAGEPGRTERRVAPTGGLASLAFLVGIVLLVASGALAAAVFLYGQYLETSAASKLSQLERARESFDAATIQKITKLDERMQTAERVLGTHIAPTAFFAALEQTTLQTVQFDTLDFSAADPQRISIKMDGLAQSVNSIALQAELLSSSDIIKNPIFSGISRQAEGVKFSLSALVNPAAINYVNLIAGLVSQIQNAQNQNVQQQPQEVAPPSDDPFNPPAEQEQ